MAESKNQEKLNEELIDAALDHNIERVKAALQQGADVNCTYLAGWTPLHHAARKTKRLDVIQVLLSAGADVNAKDCIDWTPLHWAARFNKNTSVSDLLIQAGADLYKKSTRGRTPLDVAKTYGSKEVAALIQAYMNGEKKVLGLALYQQSELDKILNNESSYESFDMRVMVVGKYGVGKTTLVMLLIGDNIPKSRSPTDGISVIEGRCGLDVSTREWIRLDKDSYNVNEFIYNRMLMPPTQDDIKTQGNKQTGPRQLNNPKDKAHGKTQSQSLKPVYPTEESSVEVSDESEQDLTSFNSATGHEVQVNVNGDECLIPKSEQDITSFNPATNLIEVQENVITQPVSDHINRRQQEEESLGAVTSDPDSKKPASDHVNRRQHEEESLGAVTSDPDSKKPASDHVNCRQHEEGSLGAVTSDQDSKKQASDHVNRRQQEEESLEAATSDPDSKKPASDHINRRQQEEESLGAATSDPDSKKPASDHVNRRQQEKESLGAATSDPDSKKPASDHVNRRQEEEESLGAATSDPDSKKPASDHVNRRQQEEESLGAATSDPDSKKPASTHPEIQFTKSKIKTKLSKDEYKKKLELALKNGTYKMQMGRLFFWDFGGQYVFYTTHQSFLTYRALFLVIFDGTENLYDIYPDRDIIPGQHGTATSAVFLEHWVNSILTYCKTKSGGIPKILFVATHKDEIPKENVEKRRTELFDSVEQLFKDHEGRNHLVLKHRIFVNARDINDPEIKTLKRIITELTFDHPCWGERMPTSWVPLELEITELVRQGQQIISLRQLEQLNNDSNVSVLDPKALKSFLLIQHSLGKIIYFDTPQLKDMVIINPLYMVDVMKAFITDKHFWPTDSKGQATFKNMAKHGIISKKGLFSLWKRKQFSKLSPYREFIFDMLLHLDIIAEQRRYDRNTGIRLETESLFVPCMLTKRNPTDYLDKVCVPEYAVGLAFVFKGSVLPPALPNRLISACLNIWALKSYKHLNKMISMLFSGFIVLNYDKSHEVVICVESHRILLFIVHKREKDLIVTDIATSVRQCMEESLRRISDFYEKCTTGQSSNQLPFHTQHACPELTCFHPASEIITNKTCVCPGHSKPYKIDVWYQNKKKNVCEENCEGLSKDALSKIPSDPELLRLSVRFDPEMMYTLAIHLGVTDHEWKYMEKNHHQNAELANYLILIQWREKHNGKFIDVFNALSDMEVDTHNLCQVRRKKIRQTDLPEEHLGSIPTDEILDALAPEVGSLSFQLGVELGRKVTELETIQYNNKLDLVEQSRKILHNWRDEQTIKATFEVLEQALVNVGRGSMCLKRAMEEVGVKQHQFQQHETQRKKRCTLM